MTKPITIQWHCVQCDKHIAVRVWPVVPARISGPPEQCYPAEGGQVEPRECEHCGLFIPLAGAHAQAYEQEADALAARADELADRRRDERL